MQLHCDEILIFFYYDFQCYFNTGQTKNSPEKQRQRMGYSQAS